MLPKAVRLDRDPAGVAESWSPWIVAEMNGQQAKIVKREGEFVRHRQDVEDELFLVLEGSLTLQFRDGDVHLGSGELLVVPAGLEFCRHADPGTSVLLFEPASTLNTENVVSERPRDATR